MPADPWSLLRAWQPAPQAGIPLAVLAAAYLIGAFLATRRRGTRRRAWPTARTAAKP